MLSNLIKDIKYRKTFLKVEKIKLIYKFLLITFLTKKVQNSAIKYRLFKLRQNFFFGVFSKVKLKSRCLLSNKSSGIVRKLGISRIVARDLMQSGVIPGYTKAVW